MYTKLSLGYGVLLLSMLIHYTRFWQHRTKFRHLFQLLTLILILQYITAIEAVLTIKTSTYLSVVPIQCGQQQLSFQSHYILPLCLQYQNPSLQAQHFYNKMLKLYIYAVCVFRITVTVAASVSTNINSN